MKNINKKSKIVLLMHPEERMLQNLCYIDPFLFILLQQPLDKVTGYLIMKAVKINVFS